MRKMIRTSRINIIKLYARLELIVGDSYRSKNWEHLVSMIEIVSDPQEHYQQNQLMSKLRSQKKNINLNQEAVLKSLARGKDKIVHSKDYSRHRRVFGGNQSKIRKIMFSKLC